jgi:hypothetical protein
MDGWGLQFLVIIDVVNAYWEDVYLIHLLNVFESVVSMNMILKDISKVPLIPFPEHSTCMATWI